MELKSYLDEMGFRYRLWQHPRACTAQRTAAAAHVPGDRVVKTVLVRADGEYVVCALPASYRVDLDLLRRELNAEEIGLASEVDLARLCDCEVGAEPPVGWLFGLPTLIDESLFEDGRVTFKAGTHEDAITMTFLDYYRLAKPAVGHFGHRAP